MQKLSEIISKNIYSLSSGRKVGYVLNIEFDENFFVKNIVMVDSESEMEAKIKNFFIKNENVFISSEEEIAYDQTLESQKILGKEIFSREGTNFGKAKEGILSGKKLVCLFCEKSIIPTCKISFIGEDIIFLGAKKAKKMPFLSNLSQNFIPQDEMMVSIMPIETQKTKSELSPYRISTDPTNLIGKMATKDIFGLNNELIIKKFEIITQKKVNEARRHNKLNILFYNCK